MYRAAPIADQLGVLSLVHRGYLAIARGLLSQCDIKRPSCRLYSSSELLLIEQSFDVIKVPRARRGIFI